MTEKRLIVRDDDYAWIDTTTGYVIEVEDAFDLINQLHEENEQLKQQLSSINQLIDNKIDEFKNGDYGDLPCNTIHMFLDLKQELGDVE